MSLLRLIVGLWVTKRDKLQALGSFFYFILYTNYDPDFSLHKLTEKASHHSMKQKGALTPLPPLIRSILDYSSSVYGLALLICFSSILSEIPSTISVLEPSTPAIRLCAESDYSPLYYRRLTLTVNLLVSILFATLSSTLLQQHHP